MELMYDLISGRYFNSSVHEIEKAICRIAAKDRYQDDYVTLNEFYEEIGLSPCMVYDRLGWFVEEYGYGIDYWKWRIKIPVVFSAALNEDDTPLLVVSFDKNPSMF